ncbi:hypothetical protein LCGC14_2055200 [marine sediment metagenome]|uniref:Uncharacterized protein n=1 Tax=marine sediment metagenome TaxID=412755 RepID=A0A0F9H1B2_9ZZZZ
MKSVANVLHVYNQLVPFPITAAKIKKAGYYVDVYLSNLITDLQKAEGGSDPKCQDLIRKIHLMAHSYVSYLN